MSGYLTVSQVAFLYRKTEGNIRTLASRNHWRRYRIDHVVRYNPDDVRKTMARDTPHRPDLPPAPDPM